MIKFAVHPEKLLGGVTFEAVVYTAAWVIAITTDGVVCVMPDSDHSRRGAPRYVFTGRQDVVDLYGGAGVGRVEIDERTQDKAKEYAGLFEARPDELIKLAAAADQYHAEKKHGGLCALAALGDLMLAAGEYGRGPAEEGRP